MKSKEKENSPSRPGEESDEPGSEMAVPGGAQDVQECPKMIRSEPINETDSPHQDWAPEGHRDL